MAEANKPPTNHKNDRSMWSVICLSVALPLVLFTGVVLLEFIRGNFPSQTHLTGGSIFNGEFLFVSGGVSGTPLNARYEVRIKCLDLKTGLIRDANLPLVSHGDAPFSIGDKLYVHTYRGILEVHDNSFLSIPAVPTTAQSIPFEYEGCLTTISTDVDGIHRLMQWKNHQWNAGPRILLPAISQTFRYDEQWSRFILGSVRGSNQTATPAGGTRYFRLVVTKQGNEYHLLRQSINGESVAYRSGFEFVDESSDVVSAMTPENADADASGWEPVFPKGGQFLNLQMVCDSEGPIFSSRYNRTRLARRLKNGTWEELDNQQRKYASMDISTIVTDPQNNETLLIRRGSNWEEGTIQRIEGNTIRPVHHRISAVKFEYARRWWYLIIELFAVWLMHVTVIAIGVIICQQRCSRDLTKGEWQAPLASIRRRAMALLIDLALLYAIISFIWILWRFRFPVPESSWRLISPDELLYALSRTENFVFFPRWNRKVIYEELCRSPFAWPFLPFDPFTDFLGTLVVLIMLYVGFTVFLEDRYGITPGKLLLGIRTIHMTRRPGGFSRMLIRKLLLLIDLPFFLTPLPAAISLMRSEYRQRIGDRLADTIVIQPD